MFKKLFYTFLVLLSYQSANSQEIKNYAEAKSVVVKYLDTIKFLSVENINQKNIRKYVIRGGNKKGIHYCKKVKRSKNGSFREEITIYISSTTIGYIILYDNNIFYARVWTKINSNKIDILTITREEYITTSFIENNPLSDKYFPLGNDHKKQ